MGVYSRPLTVQNFTAISAPVLAQGITLDPRQLPLYSAFRIRTIHSFEEIF